MKEKLKQKKIEYAEWWNKQYFRKVFANLQTLELTCIFRKRPYDFRKEGEFRLSTKEKMNKIEGLKEEVQNKEDELLDYLLDGEIKVSKCWLIWNTKNMIHCIILYY